MRTLAAVFLATALPGCFGGSTMPPGFNEACYGGDYGENLSGANPVYSATLTLDLPSRPVLRDALYQLAAKHQLKAFDDGANFNNQFFSIYLCSSRGAFVLFDDRAAGKDKIHINVFSYRDTWPSEPFISDLKSTLMSQWPNGLETEDLSATTLRNSIL